MKITTMTIITSPKLKRLSRLAGLEEIPMTRNVLARVVPALALLLVATPAFAQEVSADGYVGLGAGLGIGLAVIGGGLGQGMAARAALEGTARNPQAAGKILVPMVLGMALIESLVLFGWLVTSGLGGKVG